mgnify:CR=1 FL=1
MTLIVAIDASLRSTAVMWGRCDHTGQADEPHGLTIAIGERDSQSPRSRRAGGRRLR